MPQDATLAAAPRARLRDRLADSLTLRLHLLAERLDWIPDGFGDADPVDPADPRALRAEWRRQARIWADSSPEQLFAMKAGALMLGLALSAVVIAIAAMD